MPWQLRQGAPSGADEQARDGASTLASRSFASAFRLFTFLLGQTGVSECKGDDFNDPDLMTDRFWDSIFQCLRQGDWTFLASPPLETISRARRKRPGPAPLRSEAWPSGFPWLTDDNRAKVDAANRMFDRCVEAASICASAGGCFLLENPEDLGATKNGEREHTPRGVGWGFGLNIVTTSELVGGGGPTTQTSRSQVLVQPYPIGLG